MSVPRAVLVRDLLDLLEREETKLLSWGVVDGGFTAEEVEEYTQTVLDAAGSDLDPDDLRQELFNRRLLFQFRTGGFNLNRTRAGEAVRLFARLRQIFTNRPWQFAPTLVSDYRFARRPRRYPDRAMLPADALTRLASEVQLTPFRRDAVAALLRRDEPEPLRLAEFQYQATRRLLLDLESRYSRGLIVCAGTGTGKTLAFYIPALDHLSSLIERDQYWTKAVAIYPRNELLKDQLSESYGECRRLDKLLRPERRKLLLGAFFGPTPKNAADLKRYEPWGATQAGGYLCPFLRCPNCDGDLLWRTEDVDRGVEGLHCVVPRCRATVPGDELVLTREQMAITPPDVLFTTTEMLNRRMGDNEYGHIFGVGPNVRRPQLMLLDEVHTYTGTSGAQVALLLRRWQHALGSKVQFTGLSATLRGAGEFFGQLVGLRPGSVEEVSPKESELDPCPESVEYVLALRGDPVAGASLLSTSIQAAMLLRRILDPTNANPSDGLFGRRVFLFTDDLDVTNRLYNNLQDAEGLNSWNRQIPGEVPLASLRSTTAPDNAARLPLGQSWQLSEDIGHPIGLARPLRLSRTSSQDVGVDQRSDLVVATAALEVGYNDPEVGGVMQHKAPRDWAAFLQRKGRAGRRRSMRPWTVVVLSDYGRDRLTYQAYDQLFDPALPLRTLPVQNRYVLRMQAAYALMDWMARELPQNAPPGSVWTDFSGPPRGRATDNIRERQQAAVRILGELLDGSESRCRSLDGFIRDSLGLTEEEAAAVLWDPPRPLMTAVIPTILRRIESEWRRVPAHPQESTRDYLVWDHPLPDFVPQQLFGDLNLPEVEIVLDQQLGQNPESVFLPLVQAVRTLAPGRVTRRFGYRHAFANHWIAPPDLNVPQQQLPVEQFCEEFDEAGTYQLWDAHEVRQIRCVRPRRLHPHQPPGNVAVTSNSFPEWRSQLSPAREDDRLRFEPPGGSSWEGVIDEIRFYTHNQRNHVQVRRFVIASRASITFRDGSQAELQIRFVEEATNDPAAVGFSQESDGIAFRFRIPSDLGLTPTHTNQRKLRGFRTAYFRKRVIEDPTLTLFANPFQRDWLVQIYLSALTHRALAAGETLESAYRSLHSGNLVGELSAVLDTIFQSLDTGNGQHRQRVHDTLLVMLRDNSVTNALGALAPLLWLPTDAQALEWAAARYKATLGGALLEACQQLCPQIEADDLCLDIDPGPRPPDAPPLADGIEELWVTESTIGGGGVVEEVLRAYAADPRRFFRIAESALAATDYEVVDRELTRLLALIQTDAELTGVLDRVRSADGHGSLSQAVADLRRHLSRCGIAVTHSVMSAVHTRVIRPGSSPASDLLLRRLVCEWNDAEERLGIELDTRVYAYSAAESPQIQADLSSMGGLPSGDGFWRFQTVYGLLWPRGYQVRGQGLTFYNPFSEPPPPDRELLLDLLRADEPSVPLVPGWEERVRHELTTRGAVRLTAAPDQAAALNEAILKLGSEPLEIGFLQLHPAVVGVSHEPDLVAVTLDLKEVLP